MGEVLMVAEAFLTALALGMGFFTFLIDTRQTGAGLLKVMTAICGVSVLLSLISHLTTRH